jgi:nucleoside-diphosphate-sugar epimerase
MEHMFEESMMTAIDSAKVIKPACSKVVVLGGTGFIGNHLCRKLIEEGHHVICIDNNFAGSVENIGDLFSNSRFEYIHHNILDPIELQDNISHVYNLATPSSPKYPVFTLKTCVVGSMNAVELAQRKGARLMFIASNSDVCGDHNRMAETIMVESGKAYGFEVRIARVNKASDPPHETVSRLIDLMKDE